MEVKPYAEFTFDIVPLAKERPRSAKGGHFYTPKRTREYEEVLRGAAIRALPDDYKVPTGPVKLVVVTTNLPPVSWKATERADALMNKIYPKRGDLDNRVKAVSDALNGVYFIDDIQVVELHAHMRYGPKNSVYAAVYLIGSSNEENNASGVRVG